jgi:hypothetical protein
MTQRMFPSVIAKGTTADRGMVFVGGRALSGVPA